MELKREDLTISKTVCAGTVKTSADGDIIVPDTKADVVRVIQVDAASSITDKEIRDGKLIISGTVSLKILYIPESDTERISSINTAFKFSEQINCRDARDDMKIIASSNVSRAEFSVINSRKLRIKNIIVLDYEVIAFEDLSTAYAAEDEAELKTEKIRVYNISDICEHEFSVTQSLELPSSQQAVAEQLKVSAKISDTEYKAVEGRVVMKGILEIGLLYLAEDGGLEHAEFESPFTEVADGDNIHDDLECDIDYEIVSVSCGILEDSDGDMRLINAEAFIRVQIKATAQSELEVIKDCYVPFKKTRLDYETISVEEMADSTEEQNTLKDIVEFKSSVPAVRAVYDVVMKPYLTRVEAADKKILCEGRVEGYILYLSESSDNPVYSVRHEIPFSYVINSEGSAAGMTARVKAEIKHAGYTLNAMGDVELRCILSLNAHVIKKREEQIVSAAEEYCGEDADSRGIVIYFVQPGDSLWDISKHYAVPRERIVKYNSLDEGEALKDGTKLFIPNC